MMIKDSIYIDIIEYMRKNESNSLEIFEDYMIRCIRDLNIPIWYSNIRLYGLDIRIQRYYRYKIEYLYKIG